MSRVPEYQIYWVDLSATGTHEIVGAYSHFRMIWAGTRDLSVNPPSAVSLRLDAQVEVLFGAREDDYVPLTVNSVARGEVGRYRLRWMSQPGVWAAFLCTNDDALIGLDRSPARPPDRHPDGGRGAVRNCRHRGRCRRPGGGRTLDPAKADRQEQ